MLTMVMLHLAAALWRPPFPALLAIVALVVLIYGVRDLFRTTFRWLSGRSSLAHAETSIRPRRGERHSESEVSRLHRRYAFERTELASVAPATASPGCGKQARGASQPTAIVAALKDINIILTRLASNAEQMAVQLTVLTDAMTSVAERQQARAGQAETEPIFLPDATGIDLVVVDVPSFEGLIEIHRAVCGLAQAQSVVVNRYADEEAGIRLTLGQPMKASEIAACIGAGCGKHAFVADADAAARRIRVGFARH